MSETNKFFRMIAMIIWTITFIIVSFMVLYIGLAALSAGSSGSKGFYSRNMLFNCIKFYTAPIMLFINYIIIFRCLKKNKKFNMRYAKRILILGIVVFFMPIIHFALADIEIFKDKFSVVFSMQLVCMVPVMATYISIAAAYMDSQEIE
ncbi:MAG: hypothetical protein SPJ62_11605 [Inconstantimicrobium porci]|uniref:hypothetical protein n=1 Tax=Inconstantimicrobium porci TaxID=2652291 RepID=UPI002409D984|nr:hypothetical protein [Inconstantimicrobium porci]MDD6770578.1 hypothetical protein [Inconstantimicrobium porci]MDY5912624.1 hypothetical protein [Inconstantimicrobium porci]